MKVEKSVRDCWSEKMLNFTEAKSKLSLWYLNIETVKLVLLVLYEKVQFRKKCIYVKPVMIKSKCVWRHTLYTIRYSAPLKILKMVKKKNFNLFIMWGRKWKLRIFPILMLCFNNYYFFLSQNFIQLLYQRYELLRGHTYGMICNG